MEQDFINRLNRMISEMGIFPRQPNYRYWQTKGLRINYMFGYTTEKVKGKFLAFIYKESKKTNSWKVIKQVKFSRRWKACYKLMLTDGRESILYCLKRKIFICSRNSGDITYENGLNSALEIVKNKFEQLLNREK